MPDDTNTLARRDYSQTERDQMDASDFGDPERQAFPIKTAADVIHAASRLHNANGDQAAIKARITAIAKRKGFPLPQTWQDDDDEKSDSTQERAMSGTPPTHDPFTGTHSHAHPANGSQGDDETHNHEHSHDNDADHGHSHADASQEQARALPDGILALDGYSPHMTFPIMRSDPQSWQVHGRATVEQPDKHGTIFSYEGAKGAFARWKGNIREQHDIKKAVGTRIKYEFNNEEKGVYLLARVSKGAPLTWEKVLDGTLSDFSVNVIPAVQYGNDPRRWPKKEYQGKLYPYLPEYDYAEISLVDSGSAPGAAFTPMVRADGTPTEFLAIFDEEPLAEAVVPPPLERAGTRVSADTQGKMHDSIKHTLHAAVSQMQNCGCDSCMAAQKMIDPDGDGDIDLGGYDDPDGDAASLYPQDGGTLPDMERALTGLVERIVTAQLFAVNQRLQGVAGMLARSVNGAPSATSLEQLMASSFTRALDTLLDTKLAGLSTKSHLDEVRAEVSAVKGQVEIIAKQPQIGGPVMNANAVEKRLPTDPYTHRQPTSGGATYDAMQQAFARMSQAGVFPDQESQLNAMAAVLTTQPRS